MLKKKLQSIPLGVKAAVVYTMASVFSRGLSMITVPIFTRIMSTSEIGMVNLYNSWYSLLSVAVLAAMLRESVQTRPGIGRYIGMTALGMIPEIKKNGDFFIAGACYPEEHPESKNQEEDRPRGRDAGILQVHQR